MKKLFIIMALLTGCFSAALASVASSTSEKLHEAEEATRTEAQEEKLDIKEIIFDHLGDAYGWEMPFNHHKRIPLPCILICRAGVHFFWSSDIPHEPGEIFRKGDTELMIAPDGQYKGKLVEVVSKDEATGKVTEIYKPWDISITKNVAALFIACIVVLILVLKLARWYKKNPFKAPRRMTGAIDALTEFIYKGVVKPTLKEDSSRFAPYLLTVFYFIFFMNLLGLIVVFPGGANVTGNIAVTLVLALFTFFITNVFATKIYWKDIFWPDVPIWLKCPLPIMQVIEIFGIFTKPAALTVRLFANMMGGHMIVLILTMLIFIFAAMGVAVASGTAVISILFSVFMLLIDVLVSFIQAYVFTMLSTIFIGLAQEKEHGHEDKTPSKA